MASALRASPFELPDRLLLPWTLQAAQLDEDLSALSAEPWTAHFVADNYTGDWSVLPLRAPAGASHPILRITSHPGVRQWEDTGALAHCHNIRALLAGLHCPIAAARLMRLGPGSAIHEHCDPDLAPEFGMARLHMPLSSNLHVDFRLNGATVKMNVGECWYLRLADPHSVTNLGDTDRIHLVIDVVVNDWMRRRLDLAARAAVPRAG